MAIDISALGQGRVHSAQRFDATDIYIPIRGRAEVQLTPLPDTLIANVEYKCKIQFTDKYKFSELFFDKGLATLTDTILILKARTALTEGIDTGTLRIICFSNSNRVLLFHRYVIVAQPRVFPTLNPTKNSNITIGNLALERNEEYSKHNFYKGAVLGYVENGQYDIDNLITGIALSIVNRKESKHYYSHSDKLSRPMMAELHRAMKGSYIYIRLNIKNGKKNKSVWTRFKLVG